MFGFSNHRLFVSLSSQEHLSGCNPCLAHITLPNAQRAWRRTWSNPTKMYTQRRPPHLSTIRVTQAFLWASGTSNTHFVLMHTPRSLTPLGWGAFGSSILHRGKVSMEPAGAAGCSALLKSRTFIFRLLNELRSLNLGSYFWHQIKKEKKKKRKEKNPYEPPNLELGTST